jgi:hypothetical protein
MWLFPFLYKHVTTAAVVTAGDDNIRIIRAQDSPDFLLPTGKNKMVYFHTLMLLLHVSNYLLSPKGEKF